MGFSSSKQENQERSEIDENLEKESQKNDKIKIIYNIND